MVVTSLTHRTTAAPLWPSLYHTNILQRTTLGTKSATDAFFRCIKLFRTDHETVEHRTHHIRFQPRYTSFMAIKSLFPSDNPPAEIFHSAGSLLQLTSCQFRFIHIKSRHTNVCVGHHHRKASLATPSPPSRSPRKHLCRFSRIIATGTNKIQVIRHSLPFQLSHCFQYHRRRSPRINRKYKTQRPI